MAETITGTETYARFSLLELQIRTLLRETLSLSAATLAKVSQGLQEPHYIEQLVVQGVYDHGTLGAELRLVIDWRQYGLEMVSGGENVRPPESWEGGVAPSIIEGVRTFLIACADASLEKHLSVVYARHFDRAEVNRLLGFVPGVVRKWEKSPQSLELDLGPLKEASLVVKLGI